MPSLKFTRKKIIIIITSILVIGFIINGFVSKSIENKISEVLLKSESNYYTAHAKNSNFLLIRSSLVLNNVSLIHQKKLLLIV